MTDPSTPAPRSSALRLADELENLAALLRDLEAIEPLPEIHLSPSILVCSLVGAGDVPETVRIAAVDRINTTLGLSAQITSGGVYTVPGLAPTMRPYAYTVARTMWAQHVIDEAALADERIRAGAA